MTDTLTLKEVELDFEAEEADDVREASSPLLPTPREEDGEVEEEEEEGEAKEDAGRPGKDKRRKRRSSGQVRTPVAMIRELGSKLKRLLRFANLERRHVLAINNNALRDLFIQVA